MTILCYHAIDRSWDSPLAVTPDAFSDHIAWLRRHRRAIELTAAVERIDRSGRLPRGLVALTFDDGFACLFERALGELRRNQLPATVFVVAGTLFPDSGGVDWVDHPPSDPLRTLSVEQILGMHASGVRFGSHGLTHRDLTALTDEECVRELRGSRDILQDVLHQPIRFLAYPRGRNDARVRRLAARAGFTHAFTLPEAREQPGRYAIPRVGVYRGNGVATLRIKASRWYLPARTSPLFHRARVIVVRRFRGGGRPDHLHRAQSSAATNGLAGGAP